MDSGFTGTCEIFAVGFPDGGYEKTAEKTHHFFRPNCTPNLLGYTQAIGIIGIILGILYHMYKYNIYIYIYIYCTYKWVIGFEPIYWDYTFPCCGYVPYKPTFIPTSPSPICNVLKNHCEPSP